jgi:hypothetical protein
MEDFDAQLHESLPANALMDIWIGTRYQSLFLI